MHIFDNKEVTLATSENGLPSLWSNNRNLVNLAVSYFDVMWSKAQKMPHTQLEQKRDTYAKAQHRNSRKRQRITTQQSLPRVQAAFQPLNKGL
jgi:hypothetical protein